jgi:hypothetical protein
VHQGVTPPERNPRLCQCSCRQAAVTLSLFESEGVSGCCTPGIGEVCKRETLNPEAVGTAKIRSMTLEEIRQFGILYRCSGAFRDGMANDFLHQLRAQPGLGAREAKRKTLLQQ